MWKYRRSRVAFHFHICVLRPVKSHWALWWVHCRSILKLTCLAYQPITSSWSIACTMDSHPATSFSLCVSTKSIHGNVSSTPPPPPVPIQFHSPLLSSSGNSRIWYFQTTLSMSRTLYDPLSLLRTMVRYYGEITDTRGGWRSKGLSLSLLWLSGRNLESKLRRQFSCEGKLCSIFSGIK